VAVVVAGIAVVWCYGGGGRSSSLVLLLSSLSSLWSVWWLMLMKLMLFKFVVDALLLHVAHTILLVRIYIFRNVSGWNHGRVQVGPAGLVTTMECSSESYVLKELGHAVRSSSPLAQV
jgi:hypothetical protein